jgi:hypothetical protein
MVRDKFRLMLIHALVAKYYNSVGLGSLHFAAQTKSSYVKILNVCKEKINLLNHDILSSFNLNNSRLT